MLLKSLPLIAFALLIDLLQAAISISIFSAFLGLNLIPIIGQVISAVQGPLGLVIGIAVNGSISLTMGIGHSFATFIVLDSHNQRIRARIVSIVLRRMAVVLFGEIMPGINNLPWWTIGTLLTIRAAHIEEQKAKETEKAGENSIEEESAPRNIDGLRAAPSNQPYATAA